jgi:hypothetical protein
MPPGSALLTLPFMPFPDGVGGALFVAVNVAAVGASAVLAARIMGLRAAAMWSGFAFLLYTLNDWSITAFLGNNTPLLLLIVMGFMVARLAYRPTLAGVLLGLAIAIKFWPAVFLAPLARERAWLTMAWAVGTAAVVLGGALLWLGGPSAIGPMLHALSIDIEPTGQRFLMWITWLRVNVDWWPEWGGYVVAVLLLLIPAKGRFGYGLATLAGLSAIPNLWRHYLPTMVFGLVLTIWGFFHRREDESIRGDSREEPVPQTSRVAADPAAQP